MNEPELNSLTHGRYEYDERDVLLSFLFSLDAVIILAWLKILLTIITDFIIFQVSSVGK